MMRAWGKQRGGAGFGGRLLPQRGVPTLRQSRSRPTSSSLARPSAASSVTDARDAKPPSAPRAGRSFIASTLPRRTSWRPWALLAEGVRISSLSRAKGFKEDTILRWLRRPPGHAQAVEDVLLEDYEVSKAQVDGLWTYVGNKGQKGATKRGEQRRVLALHADRERDAP